MELVGIVGSGAIGRDAFHPHCWSGSSPFFFGELKRRGVLHHTIGVETPFPEKQLRIALSFARDRKTWLRQFWMDVGYRRSLTRQIARQVRPDDADRHYLQIGSMYNAAEVARGRTRVMSYNDSNIAQAVKSPDFPRGVPRWRIQRTFEYERFLYHSHDHLFTMGEYARTSIIEEFGVPADRVTCIGSGINLHEIPSVDPAKSYETKEILFVGIDFERKGGPHVWKAFQEVTKKHPNAVLHIVGPRELPAEIKSTRGVRCHGFLHKQEPAELARLEALFRSSVLLIMPSLYETFGIAPLEAMAYGMATIVSKHGALVEMVTPGVNGELVASGDVQGMADRMIELLDDPDRIARYGRAGRQRVEERYTWQRVVDRMLPAIEGCIAS